MNKRIRELAIEANLISPESNGFDSTRLSISQQKFAELIVKECLDSIEHYKNTSITKQIADEGVYSYEQGCIAGTNGAVLIIKEHFGIE